MPVPRIVLVGNSADMKIYIDDAGAFIPPQGKRKFSLVLALVVVTVVPAATEAALFYEFPRLRNGWPEKSIEIKGGKFNADADNRGHEPARDARGRRGYHAIDMTLRPNDVIDEFKGRQAAALTANLMPAHAEAVARRLKSNGDAIVSLSNPLFVEAFSPSSSFLNSSTCLSTTSPSGARRNWDALPGRSTGKITPSPRWNNSGRRLS
jgi:hypothetical protein